MAIRISLECGHASMLRVRTTPEGYTHDWEVFVRGVDNADISQYIEKVVFLLHETFPKPKRMFKEPPYIVKESGYAGFVIPIVIYLKNKDEPKKIELQYDLTLQPRGPAINNLIRHSEVFTNPAEDFRRKLLKGGGVTVPNPEEGNDKSESKTSVPMVGKPKLSGSDGKKSHRPIEPRATSDFADLFGVLPIKTAKVSPENKKSFEKSNYHKTLPPDKPEKLEKTSKTKHSPHKDGKKEKAGEDKKEKKEKELGKDKERSKERTKRPPSPAIKNDYQSPSTKRPQSPPQLKKQQLSPHDNINIQKSASPKIRDKDQKKIQNEKEKDKEKIKDNPKVSSDELKSDKKKRKHKDEKDSDRKEKAREKERDRSKETKIAEKKISDKMEKHEKSEKEKIIDTKVSKDDKKSPKQPKEIDKSGTKVRTEKIEIPAEKQKEVKTEKDRQKHKHRKKDKKDRGDDNRDREKREKKDKQKNNYDKDNTPTTVPSTNPLSTLLAEVQDRDSSDSANSGDEETLTDSKSSMNTKNSEQEFPKVSATDSRMSRPLSPSVSAPAKREKGEKVKKEKTKPSKGEERENRKRKRKSDSKVDEEIPVKRDKGSSFSPPLEPVSSSQSPVTVELASSYNNVKETENPEISTKQNFETETEQIAPDSTNNMLVESENEEPLVFSDDYVSQLKDLQQKIMTLQDNQELQRVVQVIAATGQYEITRKTFDFDLCALDRRTVQRLQQFFSAS